MPLNSDVGGDEHGLTSLRWDHFPDLVSTGLCELIHREELLDVTLSCEGESFRAHRLVLSICSPYFREIFKAQPGKHPTIVLCGIQQADLRALLQFMYRGEISLSKEQLGSFITAGTLLQVKGMDKLKERSTVNPLLGTTSRNSPPSLEDSQRASSSHPQMEAKGTHIPAKHKPGETNMNVNPDALVSQNKEPKLDMKRPPHNTDKHVKQTGGTRLSKFESVEHSSEMQETDLQKIVQKILQKIDKLTDPKFLQRLANLQELQFVQDLITTCEYLAKISNSYELQFYSNVKDCLSQTGEMIDSDKDCKVEAEATAEDPGSNNSTMLCSQDAAELLGEIQMWSPSPPEAGLMEEFAEVECRSCGKLFITRKRLRNTSSPEQDEDDLQAQTSPGSNVQCNNCLYYLSSKQWSLVTANTK